MLEDFTFADAIGVIGSLTICTAYFSVSTGRINPEGTPYQVINIVGAILLLCSLYFRPNLGAIIIEVLWITIAVFSLTRIWLKR